MVKRRPSTRKLAIREEEDIQDTDEAVPQDESLVDETIPVVDDLNVSMEPTDREKTAPADDPEAHEGEDENAKAEREKVQEEWEAFREEYFEIIDQLPLTLYRSLSLLRELDDQVQGSQNELLPTIHAYLTLRKSFAPKVEFTEAPQRTTPVVEESKSLDNQMADAQDEGASLPKNDTEDMAQGTLSPQPDAPKEPNGINVEISGTPVSQDLLASETPAPAPTTQAKPILHNPFRLPRSLSSMSIKAAEAKARETAPQTTRQMLGRISQLATNMVKTSEEKLALATATYDSVDRHVRALDASIKTREASLTWGLRAGTRPSNGVLSAGDAAIYAAGDQAALPEEEDITIGVGGGPSTGAPPVRPSKNKKRDREREKRRERRKLAAEAKNARNAGGDAVIVESVEPMVLNVDGGADGIDLPSLPKDMAVDPHEPVYCYCLNVSYGEMIACDNPECEREWFHLGCAGLAEPPKNKKKWYCRDCESGVPRRKRKK